PSATLQTAQKFVRNSRRSIIEPVLASFELSSDSSDREQLRRIHLRNKGGLTLRASGVHIRRNISDESADVDIATTDGDPLAVASTPGALIPLPSAKPSKPAHIKTHSPREPRARRPTPTRPPTTTTKAKKVSEPDKSPPMLPPPTTKKEKPRSETYKQAWSISEHHLLEQMLAEIPDDEKNGWSKISTAMGGRRTPSAPGLKPRTK
ncbi:hypothetical protein EI94DRAFT_1855968, partial [Lactarius quietus]